MEENKLKLVSFPEMGGKSDDVVLITYKDGIKEVVDADAFALSEELPGFVALWRENPYELIGFINAFSIKKLEIIPKNSYSPVESSKEV